MTSVRISLMEKSDVQAAASVLSRAMLQNPLHVAVFQGRGEAQRMEIEAMFSGLLEALPGVVFLAKEGDDLIGVMRMKSCDGIKDVEEPEGPRDDQDVSWRKHAWLSEWARREPQRQHWHLGPIGVLPSHQGTGVGSMLMQRFCHEVDLCRAEAYLETDLDKNVRFYEKFGFRLVAEADVLGVLNRFMLR